jgi:uncharacterized protein with beta-barrel porin domain
MWRGSNALTYRSLSLSAASVVALCLAAGCATPASAEPPPIIVGSGQTSGPVYILPDQTLKIEQGGTVTSTGSTVFSDLPNGANWFTVENSGQILGVGPTGEGIYGTINLINHTDAVISGEFRAVAGWISGVNDGWLTSTRTSVAGSIIEFTNNGVIEGGTDGINGTIYRFTNNGRVTGGQYGILGFGIVELKNAGTIEGVTAIWNASIGIGTLENSGTIRGAIIVDASIPSNARIGSLTNSGTIDGAVQASGIDSLTNSGTMTRGVAGGLDIGAVVNTGTINGPASALEARSMPSVVNSGTIHGDLWGITTNDLGSLTNSGTIIGSLHAISDDHGDTELTLLSGSRIDGIVALGAGINTLNIGRGLSLNSTFESGTPLLIGDTAGVPFAATYLGGTTYQVAAVDPTSLFAQSRMLGDLTGGIASTLGNHMEERRGTAPLNYAPERAPQTAIFKERGEPLARQYWMQGFGSVRNQEGAGTAVDSDLSVAGVVSGLDLPVGEGSFAGVFAGGSWGGADAFRQSSDVTSGFGGAYLSTELGAGFVDLAVAAGWSSFESEREVENNLAPGGFDTAEGTYNGWFVSPHIKITQPLGPVEASGSLRYAGLFLDGFAETGSSDDLTIEARELHLVVARAALTAPVRHWNGETGARARIALTGGVEGRVQFGDRDIAGTLLGQDVVFEEGDEDGTVGLFGGVSANHLTAGGTLLYVETEAMVEDDGSTRFFGRAGLTARF